MPPTDDLSGLAKSVERLASVVDREVSQIRREQDNLKASVTELSDSIVKSNYCRDRGPESYRGEHLLDVDPSYYNPAEKRFMPNRAAARAVAHIVSAVITQNKKSLDWLDRHDLEMVRGNEGVTRDGSILVGSDSTGGYLVPPEFGQLLIPLLSRYGVFSDHATVVPMDSAEKIFPAEVDGVSVHPLRESGAIPEESITVRSVTLKSKLFGAFSSWSLDMDEYSDTYIGEMLARSYSRAISRKIDECGFLGDGESTYSGMRGIMNNPDVNIVSMEDGKTAFTDTEYEDFINLLFATDEAVLSEAEEDCRFFMRGQMEAVVAKLTDASGNPLLVRPEKGFGGEIYGYPVQRTAVMPGLTASAAGKKFALFGSMRHACMLGISSHMRADVSHEALFRDGAVAMRVLCRFGINVIHPEYLAVLKTADE